MDQESIWSESAFAIAVEAVVCRRQAQRVRQPPDVVVLALPRGGVPSPRKWRRALGAPLDVFVVRKLGVPGHEEFAFGAIATGPGRAAFSTRDVVRALQITRTRDRCVRQGAGKELARASVSIVVIARPSTVPRPHRHPRGRRLATGATMPCGHPGAAKQQARPDLVAVPTASPETCGRAEEGGRRCRLRDHTRTPSMPSASGTRLLQTTDEEVRELLARSTGAGRAA